MAGQFNILQGILRRSVFRNTAIPDFVLICLSFIPPLKVRKTTHEAADKEKEDWFFQLTPPERLAHHQKMLRKIYGDRYNQPPSGEALKIKIKRG